MNFLPFRSLSRPDITVMVDWALKIDYLVSILFPFTQKYHEQVSTGFPDRLTNAQPCLDSRYSQSVSHVKTLPGMAYTCTCRHTHSPQCHQSRNPKLPVIQYKQSVTSRRCQAWPIPIPAVTLTVHSVISPETPNYLRFFLPPWYPLSGGHFKSRLHTAGCEGQPTQGGTKHAGKIQTAQVNQLEGKHSTEQRSGNHTERQGATACCLLHTTTPR